MTNPAVPENQRKCSKCGNPVGRSRGDRPGRTAGFCPHCGEAFNFAPKLGKGDLVGGQYEVVGALAHGGLGWIYLATDRNVSHRWVVLKGLLNSDDEDAVIAALAERRFLAEVEHPNIVRIYNFVEHDGAGYIIMEYVGGESLKEIRKKQPLADGRPQPLPVAEAIAYLLEIMPAFGYLHDRGLIFCDFKPDNVIQSGDQMRLIDLGGVVHVDDLTAMLYGTVGYQAPEIATDGPSIQSDLFTIGRSLATLSTDFPGYQGAFKYTLPDRADIAQYQRHESFYRLVDRATRADPAERFVDAGEMAEQMLGVLRQVLATEGGGPQGAPSKLFTAEQRADLKAEGPRWQDLPIPLIDVADPAAATLASITVTEPRELLNLLKPLPPTPEVQLRTLRAAIDLGVRGGDFTEANEVRQKLDGADWRVAWYDGLQALATGNFPYAAERFAAVYAALPGELAPQLALATTLELTGDPAAGGYYDTVSRTDPTYTTAAAGLARVRLRGNDRAGAIEAYNRVPGTSSAYRVSQMAAVEALIHEQSDESSLTSAADLISRLDMEAIQLAKLQTRLYEQALRSIAAGTRLPGTILPERPSGTATETDVRFALEQAYRDQARTATGTEKISLVDMANAARPRTRT